MNASTGPIGKLDLTKPIQIIGAGMSGLILGYYLKRAGASFTIYEKSSYAGGKIQTRKSDFGLSETAANAIFSNDDVLDIINDLELNYYTANSPLKKVVWRNGKFCSPPINWWEIIGITSRLFKTPPKTSGLSVYEFFLPLLGKKLCDELLAAAFSGIYAHDIKNLHFESIFKDMCPTSTYLFTIIKYFKQKKKNKQKSTSLGFPGGMDSFIKALEKKLDGHIQFNTEIESLTLDNVAICTEAFNAAKILNSKYPDLANILLSIEYQDVTTITIITSQSLSFLDNCFGVLFAPALEFSTLGILNNSSIFPDRTKNKQDSSYTFILKHAEGSKEHLINDFSRLRIKFDPLHWKNIESVSWTRGIPIYNQNRFNQMLKLRSLFMDSKGNTVLLGNYIDGISIREMISNTKSFVASIKS